jgi:hypothetical protein
MTDDEMRKLSKAVRDDDVSAAEDLQASSCG